jgi:DNA-binding NtrC family response regulator
MSQAGHIVVLDREGRVREAMSVALRRHGWSCDTLGDAREAAEALRGEAPTVLVVDLGVAAYRRLLGRRIETAFALPVIVGTGHRSVTPASRRST